MAILICRSSLITSNSFAAYLLAWCGDVLANVGGRHEHLASGHVKVGNKHEPHVVADDRIIVDHFHQLVDGFNDLLTLKVRVGGTTRHYVQDFPTLGAHSWVFAEADHSKEDVKQVEYLPFSSRDSLSKDIDHELLLVTLRG